MKSKLFYIFLCFGTALYAQTTDSLSVREERVLIVKDTVPAQQYDPLAPSRAAFYSAVLPGLGQAYNKKYRKIPLVYA
ncbi:MAG: hypothetical protein HKN48_03880, partial [Flavobacteriaceae bacterium]|nr:hypothetical protein [Flavobacteriaceae bacterium]